MTFLPSISPPTKTWTIIKLSLTEDSFGEEVLLGLEKEQFDPKRFIVGVWLSSTSAQAHEVTMYTLTGKCTRFFENSG